MRISARCSDERAFYGDARIDSFHIRSMNFTQNVPLGVHGDGRSSASMGTLKVNIGDGMSLLDQELQQQFERLLVMKTSERSAQETFQGGRGGNRPGARPPPFVLNEVLNRIV